MSDQEQEQTQTAGETTPAVPQEGDVQTDAEQGVGVAPTEPGDAGEDDEGGGTAPRPSSDFEDAADDADDGSAA